MKNECVYRPMDLRVAERKSHGHGTPACGVHAEGLQDWELRLLVGSAVAAEARAAVKVSVPLHAVWQSHKQSAWPYDNFEVMALMAGIWQCKCVAWPLDDGRCCAKP